jgi:Amt family ammonium transporter
MQTGYIMLSGGATRVQNVQNTMFNLVLALSVSTFWFWATGYAFARGVVSTSNAFIGERGFALDGDAAISRHDFVYHWGYLQVAVAVAAAGLLERGTTLAYVVVSTLMGLIVFPVVVFWLWSSRGWLSPENSAAFLLVLDYAGSGVVHVVGGTAALVGSAVLGPRHNVALRRRAAKTAADADASTASAQVSTSDRDGDAVMNFVGALAIWFGSYGVCQVRLQSAATHTASAALVGPNMVLSAAFAGVVAATFGAWARPKRKMRFLSNGIVAGLTAIAAGAPWQQPYSAMATGVLGGVVYCASAIVLEHTPLDDTADVVAVHLFPGILGLMVSALFVDYGLVATYFADPNAATLPILEQDQGRLFGAHLLAILCIVAWTAAVVLLFLLPLRLAKHARIAKQAEQRGLDTLIDPRAEAVRLSIFGTKIVPSNDLTTEQRQCGRCSSWLTGDCVVVGDQHYHVACFECAAHDTPLKLTETYALVDGRPFCTDCAYLRKPVRALASMQRRPTN